MMSGRRAHEIQACSNVNLNMNTNLLSYNRLLTEQDVHAYDDVDDLDSPDVLPPGNADAPALLRHADAQADGLDPVESSGAARKFPDDLIRQVRNIRRGPLAICPDGQERADQFGPMASPFETDLGKMNAVLDWITTKAPQLDRPWILVVSLDKPHFPLFVTQELWDMYPDGGDLPEFGPACASARHPYAQDLRAHFQTGTFNEGQVRGLRRGYLGCVTFVDRQLGRLLSALKETGLRSHTNVICTSDHGEMLGKFGMWWKCSLYEDSIRVPVIASGPDYPSGRRVKTPVDLHDVQASLFKSVGARRPTDWIGEPLQDIPENDASRVVFSEYHGHGTRSGGYMVRKGDWKLIYYMAAPHQLFNLAADPNELDNLYESVPQKAAELERELRKTCSPEEENQKAHKFQDTQFQTVMGEE